MKSPIDKNVEISHELSKDLKKNEKVRSLLITAISNLEVEEIDKLHKALDLSKIDC